MARTDDKKIRCSFCGRAQDQVDKITAELEALRGSYEQMRKDAGDRPQHKCKGVPYIKYDSTNYFVSDIEKKLIAPMCEYILKIQTAKNPQQLYETVKRFCDHAHLNVAGSFKQNASWKDSYKGMGAYATMQNLLRFHGCTFPKGLTVWRTLPRAMSTARAGACSA